MAAFDRRAIEQLGLPSAVLMENAGRGAADVLESLTEARGLPRRALVLCGAGNNGGDGLVLSRHLLLRGWEVTVALLVERARLSGDCALQARVLENLGHPLRELGAASPQDLEQLCREAPVRVDALLGTGLDRQVEGALARAITALNVTAQGRLTLALDLPSGLHADRGVAMGTVVRADATVTFACPKLGLFGAEAREVVGELRVCDIGVPGRLVEEVGRSALLADEALCARWLLPRSPSAHKAQSGRVLVVAGGPGHVGAAVLAARGALRAGAGLVTVVTWPESAEQLAAALPEAMTLTLDADGSLPRELPSLLSQAHALAIGPGLGVEERARRALVSLMELGRCPMVLDADALTLSAHHRLLPRTALSQRGLVLTPHAGEAARLLGVSAAQVQADRWESLRHLVELSEGCVLFKGPHTLVGEPGALPLISDRGTPALATGGTGDVLTGVLAALLVHHPPSRAALLAAHLHGLAAELWRADHGVDRGLLASEVAERIPDAIALVAARRHGLPD